MQARRYSTTRTDRILNSQKKPPEGLPLFVRTYMLLLTP